MRKDKIKNSLKKLEKKIQKDSQNIIGVLLGILLVVLTVNLIFISGSNSFLKGKAEELKELNRPVDIEIAVIGCEGCSDISSVVDGIKSKNVNVLKEDFFDYNSDEAGNLINKYGIEKLPSVLIFGGTNNGKADFNDFELNNDALVLSEVSAPYLDIESDEVRGKVEIIEIIDSSCEKCRSLSSIPLSFSEAGVSIKDWKKVEYNSAEGRGLVSKFGIKEVPAVLISAEINYYEDIKQSLIQLDLEEKQGFYSLHSTIPPYRDLSQNKIIGLVDLIMLTDTSCEICYDINVNKQILRGLGVVIESENDYDIGSSKGKELISKYNIQKVPIIILSPEAKYYESFINAWNQVGGVESDGWFVMRKPEGLGTVKDLSLGQIISR